ncbi:MAG: cobyric acid synthase [Methylovirgula sp.]
MFQGTGSDVGKSLIVAGLCRAFTRRGLNVRPFKPQNMSNNAAVTGDGEIGRAQALQAQACGVAPTSDMNPVLLKPQGGSAQIVVKGRVWGQAGAADFQGYKPKLLACVVDSFGRLKAGADLVLVEGAGSAAEVNLREGDIANMGFARAAGVPVILIGDIDRGGVIAQIVGTKAVIAAEDAAIIEGFLINKFRGDPNLFAEGMEFIERRTGWPALGLIPFLAEAGVLPAEDSMALAGLRAGQREADGAIKIAVPLLPGIANFDDLDPLRIEPSVALVLVRSGETLPADADVLLLIGSKTTIADLAAFRAEGWDIDLAAHVRRRGRVFGLCGGYQMLGKKVADPLGIEGPAGESPGLGLLDVETEMTAEKILARVSGTTLDGISFAGYEMHCGRTSGPDCGRPFLHFADERADGATSADGRISGCYVHGFFADDGQRRAFLARLGAKASDVSYAAQIEAALDVVAAHLEAHIDLDRLLTLAR